MGKGIGGIGIGMKAFIILGLSLMVFGCGSGGNSGDSPFTGIWRDANPEIGYDEYWQIHSDNSGFLCNEDYKSSTPTKIVNGKMLPYGHGTGDVLTIEGSRLKRVGEDHGQTYVAYYDRVGAVPEWCSEMEREFKNEPQKVSETDPVH